MSSSEPDKYNTVFDLNRRWASHTAETEPSLFPTLAVGQSPQILWIGCSDSRCPETTVLGLQPGDVFVHRNIANVISATDLSLNSVVEYATVYLGVKHIVVCGHTSCGGVAAALGNKKLGLIDTWLLPLRNLRRQNIKTLESLDPKEAALKLVELNVHAGVKTLKSIGVVIEAMNERGLKVHGCIYDVATGWLKEIEIPETEEEGKEREAAFKVESS